MVPSRNRARATLVGGEHSHHYAIHPVSPVNKAKVRGKLINEAGFRDCIILPLIGLF